MQRIWRAHGLQPHKTRLFKLSTDPRFAEKLVDIVGLYINPPEHAVVLSIDEKSQIQALDRTQPGLPIYSLRVFGQVGSASKVLGLRNSGARA